MKTIYEIFVDNERVLETNDETLAYEVYKAQRENSKDVSSHMFNQAVTISSKLWAYKN